jgi:hypothetical protein
MRLVKHLNEAIFDISDSDIELVYKPIKSITKKTMDHVSKRRLDLIEDLGDEISNKYPIDDNADLYVVKTFKPGELKFKSPSLQAAYKLNPITIKVGFWTEAPFYSSLESLMVLGLPWDVFMDARLYPSIAKRELSETAFKISTRHELSHWLRDSFHENILKKRAADAKWLKKVGKMGMKLYLTHTEIDAVIHSVVELKNRYSDKWDKISWKDFIKLDNVFILMDKELGQEWRKLMKKRMHRENLLGAKMR